MASWAISEQEQQELEQLAHSWGKVVARRACAKQAPGPDTHFTTMEDVAFQVSQALTQGIVEALLQRHNQQVPGEVACPDCQTLCRVKREPRTLHIRGGTTIRYDEPVCHCSPCRRDFFPLPTAAGAGQP